MEVISVLFAFAETSKICWFTSNCSCRIKQDTGSDESRCGSRGEKAVIADKLRGGEENRKRPRDEAKEKKLNAMMDDMAEI